MKPFYNWWKWHCSNLQTWNSSFPMSPSQFWYVVAKKLYNFIQRTSLKNWNRLLSVSKFYQFFSGNIKTRFPGKSIPLCSFHPHKLPLLLLQKVWSVSEKGSSFPKSTLERRNRDNPEHACTCIHSSANSMSNWHSAFLLLLSWSCRVLGSNTSQTAVNDHFWHVPQKTATGKLDLYSFEFLVRSEKDSSPSSQKLLSSTITWLTHHSNPLCSCFEYTG